MPKVSKGRSKKVSEASRKKGTSKKQIGRNIIGGGASSGTKNRKPGLPSR
jgi:hypothetical protein